MMRFRTTGSIAFATLAIMINFGVALAQQTTTHAPVATNIGCGELVGAFECDGASACDDLGCDGLVSGTQCSQFCTPLWTATADALFLSRSEPISAVLLFNTANPNENVNATDFGFGVHTGFDLSLARRIGSDNGIEFRYFSVDGWQSRLTRSTTFGDLLQLNAAVPIFTFAGTDATAAYTSQLHNAEVNVRHNIKDRLNVFAGFRYVELDERMSVNLVGSAVPFDYEAITRNRLYGAQLGGQAWIWNRGACSVDAFGKAGVFGNVAAQDSLINTGIVTLNANGRGSRTAAIGEAGVNGTIQFTGHLAARVGYRLLWVDGVALAGEQLAASDFVNATGFSGTGDVFYHGASTGLEFAY